MGLHVGFVCHFLEPTDLRHFDGALAAFDVRECAGFFRRMRGFLSPTHLRTLDIRSPLGHTAQLSIILLPFTSEEASHALRQRDTGWLVDLVSDAVRMAEELGCSVVGLGAYTSIVANNGRALPAGSACITTGNSLAVAAAVDAVERSAARLSLDRRRAAVVGAAGNIGTMAAELVADSVDSLLLVGNPGALGRLQRLAARLSVDTAVSDDLGRLRECNLVVSATNSPVPIITPEHVAHGPVVLCDLAAPADVHASVLPERPEAFVIRGGVMRLPLDQDIGIEGVRFGPNLIYACMAETIVLGLEEMQQDYSFGSLSIERVRRIRELARRHGFMVVDKVAPGARVAAADSVARA